MSCKFVNKRKRLIMEKVFNYHQIGNEIIHFEFRRYRAILTLLSNLPSRKEPNSEFSISLEHPIWNPQEIGRF